MDEYTGDYNELVYLRSRYYAPGMGRFVTSDTWDGNISQPLSYNLWNYVQSNPINNSDPTGNYAIGTNGCGPMGYISPYFAAKYYADKNVNLSKFDWLNTYTAAGIAVQCWAGTVQDIIIREADYSGLGPGQISNKEVITTYGERIPNSLYPTDKTQSRGFGLRCYIPIGYLPVEVRLMLAKSCAYCFTPDQINNMPGFYNAYQLEPIFNQIDIDGAVIAMKRRIKSAVDECAKRNCGITDKFIAAALVQNSPGFTQYHMSKVTKLPSNQQNIHQGVTMDWDGYFTVNKNTKDTIVQLYRFNQAIQGLISKNWFVPYIDKNYINFLINIKGRFPQ